MVREQIIKSIKKAIRSASSVRTGEKDVQVEFPENEEFGDYSSNIAMQIASRVKGKTARLIAEEIVEKLNKDKNLTNIVSKIEVAGLPAEASAKAGPAFINFWLSKKALLSNLEKVVKDSDRYGRSDFLKSKKYLIEHTSPNTIKTLHIGHVRNNILGMAVHNILEFVGAGVKLDAINNDRGIHVMKAVWAYLQYGKLDNSVALRKPRGKWKSLLGEWSKSAKRSLKLHGTEWRTPKNSKMKGDIFVDQFYVLGAKAEKKFDGVKDEVREMLRAWEGKNTTVRALWQNLRDWTFEGFLEAYKRLGSKHDHQWFESDFYEEGKEIVNGGLKRGVFKKLSDGAVLSRLEKYKLPDTIILRADGTSMYHTQDLRLTQLKRKKFPSDLYIWDIGSEQSLYLKQLYAMCEQLGIGKVSDYLHLSYGYVFLKSGEKMSSRKGNVISADWLMDEMVNRAKRIIEKSEIPQLRASTDSSALSLLPKGLSRMSSGQASRGLSEKEKSNVAEAVGIGAIKYGLLKPARESDIYFDLSESLSLEGNSGPYLQYTTARANSILRRAEFPISNFHFPMNLEINKEELTVLRALPKFSGVIYDAARNYSPNLLCNYLFDLAQKYNRFYNSHRILDFKSKRVKESFGYAQDKQESRRGFRIALTRATGQILKNGLSLLGIQTPERM